jgi:nicotinic acid mononucleotide adenylyltransferase
MKISELLRESQETKTAVVSWGRGMGHKGHMYLASAVIEYANRIGGDPIVFVSETVGAEDPLTPQEKISIYKTVFSDHESIFRTASSMNDVLKKLSSDGYRNVVMIFGDDQVDSFKYLEKPSQKHSNPLKIKVMSRQETDTATSELDGPRATPMRDILRDPHATVKQKWAVWRDAMPDALSDDQVKRFMILVAQRLGV